MILKNREKTVLGKIKIDFTASQSQTLNLLIQKVRSLITYFF